jgi:hypothetical protein
MPGAQQPTASWANITQSAMQEWLTMWTGAAQENLRLMTQLQEANVDAARGLGENAVRLVSRAAGVGRRAA